MDHIAWGEKRMRVYSENHAKIVVKELKFDDARVNDDD